MPAPPTPAVDYRPVERLRADRFVPRVLTCGVVLHATRGRGITRAAEYASSVRYMQGQTADGWAHRCIGPEPGDHAIMVPDAMVAGHATVLNPYWLSIEFAQAAWEADQPLTDWQYACGAAVIREWAQHYGFPLVRLQDLPSATGARGLVEHRATFQGRAYGKSDVGVGLDWDRLLALFGE